MRSLQDRYDVIYDWPSPMAMIASAEATIHAEKSIPLHSCRLSANMNSKTTSKEAAIVTDEISLRSA
jgi:hypothetical protein